MQILWLTLVGHSSIFGHVCFHHIPTNTLELQPFIHSFLFADATDMYQYNCFNNFFSRNACGPWFAYYQDLFKDFFLVNILWKFVIFQLFVRTLQDLKKINKKLVIGLFENANMWNIISTRYFSCVPLWTYRNLQCYVALHFLDFLSSHHS